jgi:hypothetical protein
MLLLFVLLIVLFKVLMCYSQTVGVFSYFITDTSGVAIDSSAVRPLSSSTISSVLSSVTGGNYTAYTGLTTTAVSYNSLFKFYVVNSLDVDAARQVLTAMTSKWALYFGNYCSLVHVTYLLCTVEDVDWQHVVNANDKKRKKG